MKRRSIAVRTPLQALCRISLPLLAVNQLAIHSPAADFNSDIEVLLPRIPAFTGASIGSDGAETFEIAAGGAQEDLLEFQSAMSGGEFAVAGEFVSIGAPRLAGFNELRIAPSPMAGGGNLELSWPSTVRVVAVEATTDLGYS
jgi:hypothetical protein